MPPKLPEDALAEALGRKGINSFHTLTYSPNEAANLIYSGWKIAEGEKNGRLIAKKQKVKFLSGEGKATAKWFLSRAGKTLRLPPIKEHPVFVIHLGLWDYHTEEERKSLLSQIILAKKAAFKLLSQDWLFLMETPEELKGIGIPEFKGHIDYLLDPNAEKELRKVEPGRVYCIGGIVDKSNRLRTSELGVNAERIAIRFMGRSGYVPNRINQILEILGLIYRGTPVEEAVLRVMPLWLKRQILKDLIRVRGLKAALKLTPALGVEAWKSLR